MAEASIYNLLFAVTPFMNAYYRSRQAWRLRSKLMLHDIQLS